MTPLQVSSTVTSLKGAGFRSPAPTRHSSGMPSLPGLCLLSRNQRFFGTRKALGVARIRNGGIFSGLAESMDSASVSGDEEILTRLSIELEELNELHDLGLYESSETDSSDEDPLDIVSSSQGPGFQLPAVISFLNPLSWSPRLRGLVLLNGLVVLVATNWVIIREADQVFDPFTFAALRFAVAAVAFSPFLQAALNSPESETIMTGGLELGVWSAIGYLTQSLGLLSTDASRASFISTFTVIVVPLLAGISGKKIKGLTWFAAVVALFGVSLLERSGAPPCIGDVWSLISAIAFGIQVFRTEHYSKELSAKAALPLLSVIMCVVTVVAAGAAAVNHPQEALAYLGHPALAETALTAPSVPWWQIIYTGLFSTDVALWFEVVALHDVSSADAAIIYTLEPVLGAGLGYAMLGERWGMAGWVGAALIVASSLGSQFFGGDKAVAAEEAASDAGKP